MKKLETTRCLHTPQKFDDLAYSTDGSHITFTSEGKGVYGSVTSPEIYTELSNVYGKKVSFSSYVICELSLVHKFL